MPINPFINLFGTGAAGGLGTAGGMAGSAATKTGSALSGLPLDLIIPLAIALLGGIFGGEDEKKEEEERFRRQMEDFIRKNMRFQGGLQNRIGGLLDPMQQALISQLMRTSNWGWPAGKQMDFSFLEKFLGTPGPAGYGAIRPRY